MYKIKSPIGDIIEIPDEVKSKYPNLENTTYIRDYYLENGYVLIKNLIPKKECDIAYQAYLQEVKPYKGFLYRQASGNPEKHIFTPKNLLLNSILNVQSLSSKNFPNFKEQSTRILSHSNIQKALQILFREQGKLVQSMFFEGNPSTWAHQDTYYLDAQEIGTMVGAWVALEDIHPGAGRFYIYPSSHKIDIQKNGGDFDIAYHHKRYKQLIIDIIKKQQLKCVAPMMEKGDVLFWNSKTIHGSLETTEAQYPRTSFTAHYIPKTMELLQYQSKIKSTALKIINGMPINMPKDQDRWLNQLIFKVETTFPKTFQTFKRLGIKLITR